MLQKSICWSAASKGFPEPPRLAVMACFWPSPKISVARKNESPAQRHGAWQVETLPHLIMSLYGLSPSSREQL